MPRPKSWIATVDSSHLPSRGSWFQNDARVVRGAEVGSDIPSMVAPTTDVARPV